MVIRRGEIWWADLPDPIGSGPGFTHPVLIVQSNSFNRSAIKTVIVAIITSNTSRSHVPGNVLLVARKSGLPKDSVVNLSQLLAVDKETLSEVVGQLPATIMDKVDSSLRIVLSL